MTRERASKASPISSPSLIYSLVSTNQHTTMLSGNLFAILGAAVLAVAVNGQTSGPSNPVRSLDVDFCVADGVQTLIVLPTSLPRALSRSALTSTGAHPARTSPAPTGSAPISPPTSTTRSPPSLPIMVLLALSLSTLTLRSLIGRMSIYDVGLQWG